MQFFLAKLLNQPTALDGSVDICLIQIDDDCVFVRALHLAPRLLFVKRMLHACRLSNSDVITPGGKFSKAKWASHPVTLTYSCTPPCSDSLKILTRESTQIASIPADQMLRLVGPVCDCGCRPLPPYWQSHDLGIRRLRQC